MMPKALHELIAQADELAARFEAYDPQPGDRDTVDPLTVLHLAALRRAEAERELAEAVELARQQHVSWRAIGDAVGTTGESARQRYGAKDAPVDRPAVGTERTVSKSAAASSRSVTKSASGSSRTSTKNSGLTGQRGIAKAAFVTNVPGTRKVRVARRKPAGDDTGQP